MKIDTETYQLFHPVVLVLGTLVIPFIQYRWKNIDHRQLRFLSMAGSFP